MALNFHMVPIVVSLQFKIKIPKETTIYDGPLGSQGGIYQGGLNKEQIFIDSPWNIDGVDVIDS